MEIYDCMLSGISTGGDGGRVPPDFGEVESPRFYSNLVVDIPLGRYRATECSATFDDTRLILSLHAVQN
jgi:hypothetical protein